MLFNETFIKRPEGITVQSVENFYKFKSKIKVVTDKDALIQICGEEGIVVDDQYHDMNLTEIRKKILNAYLSIHFSKEASKSLLEQREKQESNIEKLTNYLGSKNSKSILWVGGSLGATDKTKSTQSDLDLFFALPKCEDDTSIDEESSIFRNLNDIGFIIINRDKSIEGLRRALKTGRGLARLSGMTKDGVELDFHCVGIDDVKDMDKLKPGWIERVPKTEDYFESRISFIGNHKVLPKLGERLFNYLDSDGEMFKGFYPDNFSAGAKLFFDPTGDGEKISSDLWRAIVKAFLFHNNAYKRDASGRVTSIDKDNASFEGFLRTLHYQSSNEYSEDRLKYLKDKYNQTLEEIMRKFHLT
ncbi:MAG: hypothetical protein UU10_C0045G0003 [Parcubacteria group bacterium GW2011_GWF1_40_6]|uniref:Uncharacterized protein n=2 Tax=Candidatus Nomuraibacteriota TaxID=1752729 RepID=A0A0G0TVE2_9BACT|nr:MAG: hypothetical protein UT78_C0019G0022 [Candidatus Nomurabacteria bacterium GW2011_GWF2_40_12]KKR67435.1 MAG: hypothetical protein UU10_C0045G0003 [Parcubacteria group bacterium GW2011_GWF1_40_6]OGJ09185.1 MAG: hypothetical protein A2356_03700 [Candidatus Nomurabacteria bacterium RIFOXYB1_FULL_39_16]OGJ15094.1 MAG: hypothetical protein A2585_00650 [Candidatus Nomurabacteria bacterium RIFOXYD1_FULL_39_12]